MFPFPHVEEWGGSNSVIGYTTSYGHIISFQKWEAINNDVYKNFMLKCVLYYRAPVYEEEMLPYF
jgi:hypothetical protein